MEACVHYINRQNPFPDDAKRQPCSLPQNYARMLPLGHGERFAQKIDNRTLLVAYGFGTMIVLQTF